MFLTSLVYSTTVYDNNKLNNNHTVLLYNGDMGLIENFYEIESKKYAVIRLLQKNFSTLKFLKLTLVFQMHY